MSYPSYYPDNCPPAEADPIAAVVYRAISGIEPAPEDFVPFKLALPHRDFGKDECKACGLSVFKSLTDIERTQARYQAWRDKKIAKGTLDEHSGATLNTGQRSHLTWWVAVTDPHHLFEAI